MAVNRVRGLADPEEFGAWLYALARNECVRVGVSDDAPADAAGAARGDRLARLALDCYSMLEPENRELLDLAFRHRLVDADLALVLGQSEAQISSRVTQAQGDLETALLVVLAARTGDPKCPDASDFGRRFDEIDGKGVTHWLQAASRHVERCAICGDAVRNRRPLRLFEELPHSFMPPGVRSRVLEALRDPAGSAFAEQIADRAGRFDEAGFPTGGSAKVSNGRKWIMPAVIVGAVVCGVGVFMWMTHGSAPAATADTVTTTSSATAGVQSTDASASAGASDSASASASASLSPSASASTSAAGTGNQNQNPGTQQSSPPPVKQTSPSQKPTTPKPSHSTSTPAAPPSSSSASASASASPSTSGSASASPP